MSTLLCIDGSSHTGYAGRVPRRLTSMMASPYCSTPGFVAFVSLSFWTMTCSTPHSRPCTHTRCFQTAADLGAGDMVLMYPGERPCGTYTQWQLVVMAIRQTLIDLQVQERTDLDLGLALEGLGGAGLRLQRLVELVDHERDELADHRQRVGARAPHHLVDRLKRLRLQPRALALARCLPCVSSSKVSHASRMQYWRSHIEYFGIWRTMAPVKCGHPASSHRFKQGLDDVLEVGGQRRGRVAVLEACRQLAQRIAHLCRALASVSKTIYAGACSFVFMSTALRKAAIACACPPSRQCGAHP